MVGGECETWKGDTACAKDDETQRAERHRQNPCWSVFGEWSFQQQTSSCISDALTLSGVFLELKVCVRLLQIASLHLFSSLHLIIFLSKGLYLAVLNLLVKHVLTIRCKRYWQT